MALESRPCVSGSPPLHTRAWPSTTTKAHSLLSLAMTRGSTPRARSHVGRRRDTTSYAVLPSVLKAAISWTVRALPLRGTPDAFDVPDVLLAQPTMATIANG